MKKKMIEKNMVIKKTFVKGGKSEKTLNVTKFKKSNGTTKTQIGTKLMVIKLNLKL